MDSSRFDTLARRFSGPATRRTALAGLGAAFTRLLPGTTSAQPRTTCRELGQVCIPERNIDCCPGSTCRNGRCRCPEGKRRCQGECVSVRRCCGDACGGGAVCREGRCVCPAGTRRCGERCVSKRRCCPGQKRCGQRCIRQAACCGGCPPMQVCRAGQCERTGCATGTKPCNGSCIPEAAACCTAQGKAAACGEQQCGTATDSCTDEVYACGPAGDACASRGFTCTTAGQCDCPDSRATCPTSGASPTCCLAGQVCKDGTGVCCRPTTCAAQGGACGNIPDGCGGTLDCGSCLCSSSGVCNVSVVGCGSGNCRCYTTTENEVFCFLNTIASIGDRCDSSDTCPEGSRCWVPGVCLGSGKCLRLCPTA